MEYVAFEIGRGGPKQPRRPAADLLQERNRKLDEAHVKVRFELAFRPSGNYVLTSDDTVSAIASALHDRLNRKFVVFAADEFLGWLSCPCQRSPTDCRRAERGG